MGDFSAMDAEEGRRRREDNMVEIRKNKREESLMKKRREGMQVIQDFPPVYNSSHAATVDKKLESFPDMIVGVWSDDSSLQLENTTQFRKLLSIERSPPIEQVIDSGVVPRFVEFLKKEDYPALQQGKEEDVGDDAEKKMMVPATDTKKKNTLRKKIVKKNRVRKKSVKKSRKMMVQRAKEEDDNAEVIYEFPFFSFRIE